MADMSMEVPFSNDAPARGIGEGGENQPSSSAGSPTAVSPAAGPQSAGGAAPSSPATGQGAAVSSAVQPPKVAVQHEATKDSAGTRMLHGILDALGGTNDVMYQRDLATGKMIATHVKSGPGQQWKKIIGGALTGLAAGAGAAPGPGQAGRGFSAGFKAGGDMVQGQDKQKYDRANADFDAQQKATVQKAQVAQINQGIAESAWRLTREKGETLANSAQLESQMHSLVMSNPENKDMGVYKSFNDFLEKHGDNAQQIAKMNTNQELRAIPSYTKDGELNGVHIYQVTPEWSKQKNTEPVQVAVGTKLDKDGKVVPNVQTIPAGGSTNGEIASYHQATAKEILDAGAKVSEAKKNNAEAIADTEVTPKLKYTEQHEDSRAAAADSKKADARGDHSYQFHAQQLDKVGKPIEDATARMGRLRDTLAQGTPQADALVAPELLTVMAGGQGSGLRMNEAEIARIIGGRSHLQNLKAALQKFSTDPSAANSITTEQRQQINALVGVVSQRLETKQNIITEARQKLVDSGDPTEHRQILADTHKKLDALDGGGIQVTDPRGHVHTFIDQASADKFKKAAGIK